VQISAIYTLQIWMHLLGICKIPKTNVQATSGLRDDNILVRSMAEREGRERER
jgi:hypothetical protein